MALFMALSVFKKDTWVNMGYKSDKEAIMFKRISSKLVAAFAITTLIAISIVITLTTITYSRQKTKAHEDVSKAELLLQELIEVKKSDAISIAANYAGDSRIVEALSSDSRAEMQAFTVPVFTTFSELNGLAVFEVGDSTGKVFFRAHNPDKYGDDKHELKSIAMTLEGNRLAGTETGSSGIAIRAFAPIMKGEKVIGTLQTGYSGDFFESFKKLSSVEIEVFDHEKMLFSTVAGQTAALKDLPENEQSQLTQSLGGKAFEATSGEYIYRYLPIEDPS